MALEWLKGILGEAYTEAIDTAVAAEIGKGFVARADFNAKNEELKQAKAQISTHEKQLEEIKASAGVAEELKSQITALQEQNNQDKAAHEAELVQLRMDMAVDKALSEAGAKNNIAAKALLAEFLKDAKLDKDGAVKGLVAELESLAKAEGTAFMFGAAESTSPQIKGMKPGERSDGSPASSSQSYETRLAEARKANDNAAAIAIKREAAENGVVLM